MLQRIYLLALFLYEKRGWDVKKSKKKRECNLRTWFEEKDDTCKTCALAAGFSDFTDILEDGGYRKLAKKMEKALDADDAEEAVLKVLDEARETVDEDTKKELNDLSCELQDVAEETAKEIKAEQKRKKKSHGKEVKRNHG